LGLPSVPTFDHGSVLTGSGANDAKANLGDSGQVGGNGGAGGSQKGYPQFPTANLASVQPGHYLQPFAGTLSVFNGSSTASLATNVALIQVLPTLLSPASVTPPATQAPGASPLGIGVEVTGTNSPAAASPTVTLTNGNSPVVPAPAEQNPAVTPAATQAQVPSTPPLDIKPAGATTVAPAVSAAPGILLDGVVNSVQQVSATVTTLAEQGVTSFSGLATSWSRVDLIPSGNLSARENLTAQPQAEASQTPLFMALGTGDGTGSQHGQPQEALVVVTPALGTTAVTAEQQWADALTEEAVPGLVGFINRSTGAEDNAVAGKTDAVWSTSTASFNFAQTTALGLLVGYFFVINRDSFKDKRKRAPNLFRGPAVSLS